jgi:hypothetical protein
MAGFILFLLPNIEKLHVIISWDTDRPTDGLAYVFLKAAEFRYRSTTSPSLKPLSRLRDLTISHSDYYKYLGIRSLFPYLAHHTLQSFTGNQIEGQYFVVDEDWSLLSPELRLKSLRLQRSKIHTQTLHKLLQLCPVLEILEYEHKQSRGETIFEPEKFTSSIEHLKPCLRKLVLYRSWKDFRSPTFIAEEATTISLSAFEKLTNLSITANLLLGGLKPPNVPRISTIYQTSHQWRPPPPKQKLTQCLPKSLEYLCLRECGEGIHEDVSELVEQAAIVTPNLKTLVLTNLEFEYRGHHESSTRGQATERLFRMNQNAARRFEEDCIAKGIELSVLYNWTETVVFR